ncbi:histidine phosphatase superfamily [Dichotomopilus funicola]|uniref:Histidine phosphatase superfamily n=1 Tax=Dichotomopilus funicola TaxID=1934379 RepID=A0AAN6ZJ96_9PEZI|nr:histidine phosphatase superfamily [Dichotomopilus funicola]
MTIRLFLVRHGETVDNVAGVYAGSRDSPLTAHGVLQARRLGAHLASHARSDESTAQRHGGRVTHVFASDLKRAVETAQAIVDAQLARDPVATVAPTVATAVADGDDQSTESQAPILDIVQLPELRERDFGTGEGAKFGADLSKAGMESREAMRQRAERFVINHLAPLLRPAADRPGDVGHVVVVAHGLILDSLLRVVLVQFGAVPQEETRSASWGNTGYAELAARPVPGRPGEMSGNRTASPKSSPKSPSIPHTVLAVVGVNILTHLEGLKKTRGGIGSAKFDKRQRTVDSFFGPAKKKVKAASE